MLRAATAVLALAFLGLVPSSALAATASTWSGKAATPAGQTVAGTRAQTLQLRLTGNRIVATDLGLVMVCTDRSSGAVRSAAFNLKSTERAAITHQRFALNFIARSGGWHVLVNMAGRLASNGTGTAQVQVTASGVTEGINTVAESCSASASWRIKRGHSS